MGHTAVFFYQLQQYGSLVKLLDENLTKLCEELTGVVLEIRVPFKVPNIVRPPYKKEFHSDPNFRELLL